MELRSVVKATFLYKIDEKEILINNEIYLHVFGVKSSANIVISVFEYFLPTHNADDSAIIPPPITVILIGTILYLISNP